MTFRRGRPVAAYLYLPRKVGEKSARTVPMEHGLLVDYNGEDVPIGVEITAPEQSTVEQVDELLGRLGFAATEPVELAPLRAARATIVTTPQTRRTAIGSLGATCDTDRTT